MSGGPAEAPATSPTTSGDPPGTSISRTWTPWRSRSARVASAPSASASRRALIVGTRAYARSSSTKSSNLRSIHAYTSCRVARSMRSVMKWPPREWVGASHEPHQLPHRHAQEERHRAQEALDHERPPGLLVREELTLAGEVDDRIARVD